MSESATCWLFQGVVNRHNGYGSVALSGKRMYAHRYMWAVMRGPIATGLEVHHLCRTRHCVNPQHMRLVTRAEHMKLEGNGVKTHCPAGHEYNDANTHVWTNGHRHCRICDRLRKRAAYVSETKRPYRWKS